MMDFLKDVLKYALLALVIIGSGAVLVVPAVSLISAAKTTGLVIYAIGAAVYTLLLIGTVGAIIERQS